MIASASDLVMRPSLPLPDICDRSMPLSAAMRCTDGGAALPAPLPDGGGALASAGFGFGSGAGSALASGFGAEEVSRPAPAPKRPSSAPISTVSPSPATISFSTPASGADTSTDTLSVSSSTSVSSFFTESPACFSHLATVASVTLSPRVGTTMSGMIVSYSWPSPRRGRANCQPSASSSSCSNSFKCLLISPAAVDAVAGRPA